MSSHDHRGDVAAHRCPACVEAWLTARTVPDLGVLGARWLTGELELQPHYFGEAPDSETDGIIPALATLNRAGLWTTWSQPGMDDDGASAQRAYVSGFATPELADAIEDAALRTELVVLACPADTPGSFSVPVTIDGGQPFTFGGRGGESPDEYASELSPEAVAALRASIHLEVLDPRWGRNDLLWEVLVAGVGA